MIVYQVSASFAMQKKMNSHFLSTVCITFILHQSQPELKDVSSCEQNPILLPPAAFSIPFYLYLLLLFFEVENTQSNQDVGHGYMNIHNNMLGGA